MSTLRVTNVQDTAGANSLTTAQIYNGAAKAWVNFNGKGAVAIRANFNVSSITDNGTGDYTVNFSNALSDANYSAVGTASEENAPGGFECWGMLYGTFTTTSCRVTSIDYNSNNRDVEYNCWTFFN